jgi:hypothetical protein
MAEAIRLSQWIMAIANNAAAACTNRQSHFTKLTCDWLMICVVDGHRMRFQVRWRFHAVRSSRPSLLGVRASINWSASASAASRSCLGPPCQSQEIKHH